MYILFYTNVSSMNFVKTPPPQKKKKKTESINFTNSQHSLALLYSSGWNWNTRVTERLTNMRATIEDENVWELVIYADSTWHDFHTFIESTC
jgi:hypothetical protein